MKNFLFLIFLCTLAFQWGYTQCPIDIKGKRAILYRSPLPENSGVELEYKFISFSENLMSVLQDRSGFGSRLVNEDIAAIEMITGNEMPETNVEIGIILTFRKVGSEYECKFNVSDVTKSESCTALKIRIPTTPLDEDNNASVRDLIYLHLIAEKIFVDPNPQPAPEVAPPPTSTTQPITILKSAEEAFANGKHQEAAELYKQVQTEVNNFPQRLYPLYYLSKNTQYLEGIFVPSTVFNNFIANVSTEHLLKIADELDNKTSGYTIANSNDEFSFVLLEEAHKKGNNRAAYKLGIAYMNGRGVAENLTKGEKLLEQSCNQGYADACIYLVNRYLSNSNKNCTKAEQFLNKIPSNTKSNIQSIRTKYNEICNNAKPVWRHVAPVKPLIVESTTCPTTGCNNAQPPKWVSYTGSIPTGAIIGGKEGGTDLYVCRCNYQGGKHVGKVVNGRCNIGWGGKEIAVAVFELLTGDKNCSYIWQPWTGGKVPDKAIKGGFEGMNSGKYQYIVKAEFNNSVHPGKLIDGQSTASIGYGTKEEWVKPTHILVSCATKTNNADDFYFQEKRVGECMAPRLKWETYSAQVMSRAFKNSDNDLAICRCNYQNGIHAGKVVAGKCNIGFGGIEIVVSNNFEVLTEGSCHLHWVKWSGKIPLNAVVAGVVNENNGAYNTYIIKGVFNGTEQTGKLLDGWTKGAIGFGGKEEFITPTHILCESR